MATRYQKIEITIINIYIGCKLRLERLKRNLSQHEVGIENGFDGITIGRIERAEHISSWSVIYLVSGYLGIEFASLFKLKSKAELLEIVNQCHALENKLTKEKEKYYSTLLDKIEELFSEKNA